MTKASVVVQGEGTRSENWSKREHKPDLLWRRGGRHFAAILWFAGAWRGLLLLALRLGSRAWGRSASPSPLHHPPSTRSGVANALIPHNSILSAVDDAQQQPRLHPDTCTCAPRGSYLRKAPGCLCTHTPSLRLSLPNRHVTRPTSHK